MIDPAGEAQILGAVRRIMYEADSLRHRSNLAATAFKVARDDFGARCPFSVLAWF